MFQGRPDKENTIYSIWEHFIQEKREGGKAGTARCSDCLIKKFNEIVIPENVSIFLLSSALI